MSEPLDLEPIRERSDRVVPGRSRDLAWASRDRRALLAEVDRLRDELARRDEQIAAVRALHHEAIDECSAWYPCATIEALDGGAS